VKLDQHCILTAVQCMQVGPISVSSLELTVSLCPLLEPADHISLYSPPQYYTGIKLHSFVTEAHTCVGAQFAQICFNHS